MLVKFLQDFQGRETNEQFYKLGEVVDLPSHIADRLLTDKRVEPVNPAPRLDVEFEHDPIATAETVPYEPHPVDEPVIEEEAPKPAPRKRGRK